MRPFVARNPLDTIGQQQRTSCGAAVEVLSGRGAKRHQQDATA